MNLFQDYNNDEKYGIEARPLAERMRASSLDLFFGQEHLTGNNSIIRDLLNNKKIFSLILWGPPGSGKTTLAKLLSCQLDYKFHTINAVSSSVKEIRAVISEAKYDLLQNEKTILFIDEIHRFNKSQQDALLAAVEKGLITLIGATTENPSFEVNNALLSRCKVLKLNKLADQALANVLKNALENDQILKKYQISITKEDSDVLIEAAGGDARKLLNSLELSVELSKKNDSSEIIITKEAIKKALVSESLNYDKKSDYHYDTISAFIKSIRGSDPDAAIFYLAAMLKAGEDPKFIARRLIISASEDIGNASPNALLLAKAAFESIHVVGMPEARIILAQVTAYLASQPKSNAAYLAINKALAYLDKNPSIEIPLHLRNAPTKLMKKYGYGKGYKYAHDYEGGFTQQDYLPQDLKDEIFYNPKDLGQEAKIRERLRRIWKNKKKYQ